MTNSRQWTRGRTATMLALVLMGTFVLISPADAKKKKRRARHGVCTTAAFLQFDACYADIASDYATKVAFCINTPDEKADCIEEARAEHREGRNECWGQRGARIDLCREIGEAPYDPDLDPRDFQDPRRPNNPNPWFPLDVGNRWVYEEDGEQIEIEIQDETKRIAGIDCIVYRDIVTEEGLLVEDTDDWFAIRSNGDIEYCGEEVKDYEYFEGDDPMLPELTAIDGRFKAGVDLAKSGIVFPGDPIVGTTYRQEWDPGNAEDIGTVLSIDYEYGKDPELDELVPEELAELMCSEGDCVVIADRSTLEPDAFERKYYARGIGKFLETKPEDGEFVPLVECNLDARCDELPIEGDDEEEDDDEDEGDE